MAAATVITGGTTRDREVTADLEALVVSAVLEGSVRVRVHSM